MRNLHKHNSEAKYSTDKWHRGDRAGKAARKRYHKASRQAAKDLINEALSN
jgi:hypothetical protein